MVTIIVFTILFLFSFLNIYFGIRMYKGRKKAEKTWPIVEGTLSDMMHSKQMGEYNNQTINTAEITFEYSGTTYEIISHYNIKPGDFRKNGKTDILVNESDIEKSIHYLPKRHYTGPKVIIFTGGIFLFFTVFDLLLLAYLEYSGKPVGI